MKRLALAAAAALAMLGSAQAQQTSPFYGELGYTGLRIDGGDFSVRPGAIRGIVGYDFHPWFGVEGMLAGGVRDDDTSVTVLGVPVNVNVDLKHMYGLYVKPKYAFNQFEVFGRLGWARTKIRTEASAFGLRRSGSDSDDDFSYGVGVNYSLTARMGLGLDYMVYYDKGDTKVDGWTLSFRYRF